MRAIELQAITEEIVGSLEHGLFESPLITEWLGTDLQLRYSVCGLATAGLQRYLAEYHDVRTRRILIDLPEESPNGQTRHVFLRHGDDITIDPTYSQFFDYAGFTANAVSFDHSLAVHYPETKIAVIEDKSVDRFVATYALQAYRAGIALNGRAERSVEDLKKIYGSIWRPRVQSGCSLELDPMVTRLVERMADH